MSFDITENDKAHRCVQHGYFGVGVVDRGRFSLLGRSWEARKKTNMIQIMVLAGVERTKMLVRPSVNELIT